MPSIHRFALTWLIQTANPNKNLGRKKQCISAFEIYFWVNCHFKQRQSIKSKDVNSQNKAHITAEQTVSRAEKYGDGTRNRNGWKMTRRCRSDIQTDSCPEAGEPSQPSEVCILTASSSMSCH